MIDLWISYATIITVYRLLEEKGGLKILEDSLIYTATQEILPDPNKSRAQVSGFQMRRSVRSQLVLIMTSGICVSFCRSSKRLREKNVQ